jgi:hypothetical protein
VPLIGLGGFQLVEVLPDALTDKAYLPSRSFSSHASRYALENIRQEYGVGVADIDRGYDAGHHVRRACVRCGVRREMPECNVNPLAIVRYRQQVGQLGT